MKNIKFILSILIFFISGVPKASAELEMSNYNNVFYFNGKFDNYAADVVKSHCKSKNLNTFFVRSKDKKIFDVQVKLFKKNKWRVFCAKTFEEAEKLFNTVLLDKSFKSNILKVDRSQIELRYWKTRAEPIPKKQETEIINNESGNSEINIIFIIFGLFGLGILIFILTKNKNSKNTVIKKVKEKNLQKNKINDQSKANTSKEDLINEWKAKREKFK